MILVIVLIFLGIIILALIGYIIYKLNSSSSSTSTSTTPSSSNSIWTGKCDSTASGNCDANNNCSISCKNKIVFANKNVCGKIGVNCDNNGNCTSSCSESPRPILSCSSGTGIWQGQCSSMPSVTTSNRNVTIKCDNQEIVSRALCDDTSVKCNKDQCVVCCKVNEPPPEPPLPTCPEGSNKVWPSSGGQACPFIETRSVDENGKETDKLYCSGNEVFSGQCGELSTLCTNGKCIACCTPGEVRTQSPPSCRNGTEVWRTNDPAGCTSINSSCENGTCIATCNGRVVYTDSSGYTKIENNCNNVGCVVCAM